MSVALPPFQAFLDEHREHVYRFLVSSVGRDEADDCFQETLLAALRAYPRLRNGSNLRGWVLTIAHRKALDSHRARGRRATPAAEPVERVAPHNGYDDGSLWEEVRRLPDKQRAALVLRYANDLDNRQIGRVLGCSDEAARRNVHEGLKKLREVWQA
jgi:RNA polymerase sigma factor (sigma-70 family)